MFYTSGTPLDDHVFQRCSSWFKQALLSYIWTLAEIDEKLLFRKTMLNIGQTYPMLSLLDGQASVIPNVSRAVAQQDSPMVIKRMRAHSRSCFT